MKTVTKNHVWPQYLKPVSENAPWKWHSVQHFIFVVVSNQHHAQH